jgi:3-deoxy-D-manno-octulosonic-acid transferase
VFPLLEIAYSGAAHLATALAQVVPPGEGKLRRSFTARAGVVGRWEAWARAHRDNTRQLVWFHAPSVGEGLQARPVMELIRTRHPEWQVAYSFFSPSAERFAAGLPADYADFLPFDTRDAARRLLDALGPSALVYSKLDVWPVLAQAAAARGVALGMVSATVAPNSGRQGPFARALLRDAHGAFRAVGAISQDDARRLAHLGFPPEVIQVSGDTRYDQVMRRAASVQRDAGLLARLAASRSTLVAGSTWPSDEAILLKAWERVRSSVPGARLVIAPHEPTEDHLTPIESWARAAGISCTRLGDATAATEVVLVDRVGVLGELYGLAAVAWVGGGFHAAGLHSVLEPAAFGAPVVFGPRHTNARDAGLLLACGGGRVVATVDGAATELVALLREPADAGARARSLVENGAGAAERSYELVRDLMQTQASSRL